MKSTSGPYLTYKLELIQTQAIKAADRIYKKDIGLSLREIRLLRFIHDYPKITATDLVGKMVLDKALLSKNIAVLEKKGLIKRETSSHDSRVQCLFLTEDGEKVWQQAEIIGRGLENITFGSFSDEEWENLHASLDKLIELVNKWQASLKK
ncbi:MarR family winged helix-turn-helix transcriptional regulator [Microvirga sp. W0021]|uniref:MarR family winged helix-turn-helix transcriptional regulator n=1 Tax=Hohaiivirga grylli TaxID=3133970 RepID=A0ABV0BKI3_9HYPH